MKWLIIGLLALLFCGRAAEAVFQDEAYVEDWAYELIGSITGDNIVEITAEQTAFVPSGGVLGTPKAAPPPREAGFVVATDRNLLAFLDGHSGRVKWRIPLGLSGKFDPADSVTIHKVEFAPESGRESPLINSTIGILALISNEDKNESSAQLWNPATGFLLWETHYTGPAVAVEPLVDSDVLLVFRDGTVRKIDTETGRDVWTERISSSDPLVSATISEPTVADILVAYSGGGFAAFETLDGQPSTAAEGLRGSVLAAESNLVLTQNGEQLTVNFLSAADGRRVASAIVPTSSGLSVAEARFFSAEAKTDLAVVFHGPAGLSLSVFTVDATKSTVAQHFTGLSASDSLLLPQIVHFDVNDGVLPVVADNKLVLVPLFCATECQPIIGSQLSGNVAQLLEASTVMIVLAESPNQFYYKTTLMYQSEAGELLRSAVRGTQQSIQWTRLDSLSDVLAAGIVDLEVEGVNELEHLIENEESGSVAAAFVSRVTRHAEELLQALRMGNFLSRPTALEPEKMASVFGFRKLVVAATSSGTVYGLNSVNGEVLWRQELPKFGFCDLRIVGDKVFVVYDNGSVVYLDGKTGQLLAEADLKVSAPVAEIFTAPGVGLVAVAADGSAFSVENPQQAVKDFFYYTQTADALTGWAYSGGVSAETWTFPLGEAEEIVTVAEKPPREQSASVGRVLADRSVLYKYLQPQVIAVVVANKGEDKLKFVLLDAVSGHVLYSAQHSGERVDFSVPICATFGEHWVVWSYFSESPFRATKVVSVDLYESLVPNVRVSKENMSAFDIVAPPAVVAQSFALPKEAKIVSLSATHSKFGVTARGVVCVMETGEVLLLPRMMLDARRPVGRDPNDSEKKEGLVRSDGILPVLNYQAVELLSHNRNLQFADAKVVISPSNLESTAFIFVFGSGDVFYTRISPSGQFDMLTKTFGYGKLLITVSALVVILVIVEPMVRKRQLYAAWHIDR